MDVGLLLFAPRNCEIENSWENYEYFTAIPDFRIFRIKPIVFITAIMLLIFDSKDYLKKLFQEMLALKMQPRKMEVIDTDYIIFAIF